MNIYSPVWGIIQKLNEKNIYIQFIDNHYSIFSPISGILTTKNNKILEFVSEGKKLKIIFFNDLELYYDLPMIVLIGQNLGSIKSGNGCEIEFEDRVYFLVDNFQNVIGGVSQYPIAIFK